MAACQTFHIRDLALRRHNADLKERVQQISHGKVGFAVITVQCSAVQCCAVQCSAVHDVCAMQAYAAFMQPAQTTTAKI